MPEGTASMQIRVFNGAREPFPQPGRVIYRVFDGNNKQQRTADGNFSEQLFQGLPVFDNLGDRYRVVVSTGGHHDAGAHPVVVAAGKRLDLEFMMVPRSATYNFARAQWDNLAQIDSKVNDILATDLSGSDGAARRWQDTFEQKSETAACLLNILTIMAGTTIAAGKQLLGLFKQATFDDSMKRDRFFGWADRALKQQLELPAETSAQVKFHPADFSQHPGATASFKAHQFAEANLQITLHENVAPPAGRPEWMKVEFDVDYFADPFSHFFLEVVVNNATKKLTDPAQVLALRWMAERRAGRNFDPLYRIV